MHSAFSGGVAYAPVCVLVCQTLLIDARLVVVAVVESVVTCCLALQKAVAVLGISRMHTTVCGNSGLRGNRFQVGMCPHLL